MSGGIQLEFLRLVLLVIREYYEQYGDWPSEERVRALINRPGS